MKLHQNFYILQEGYGNVTAFCTPCECNLIGSRSDICDPHTGMCECQPGVEGFHCDACQHLHYGFSEAGCQSEYLPKLSMIIF